MTFIGTKTEGFARVTRMGYLTSSEVTDIPRKCLGVGRAYQQREEERASATWTSCDLKERRTGKETTRIEGLKVHRSLLGRPGCCAG